jgi:hypothetical protein
MKYLSLIIAPFFPRSKTISKKYVDLGYSKIIQDGLIWSINKINLQILEKEIMPECDLKKLTFLPGLTLPMIYQFDKQWKSNKLLGNLNFTVSLSLSRAYNKKLIYPLSKAWAKEFNDRGIYTNSFFSRLLFQVVLMHRLLTSILKTGKFLFKSMGYNKTGISKKQDSLKYLYLPNLLSGHFLTTKEATSFTLVGWLNSYKFAGNLTKLLHSNKSISHITHIDNGISLHYIDLNYRWNTKFLKDIILRIKLLFSCIRSIISLKNKKIFFLHFYEILLAIYLQKNVPREILNLTLFDQSQGPIAPLWTAALKNLECKSILFFYAIAAEPKSPDSEDFLPSLWSISNWDEFWVVDREQEAKLKSVLHRTNHQFTVIGVPYWIDSRKRLSKLPNSIALFDSEPQRDLYFISSAVAYGLYTEEFYFSFFHDVMERAKFFNYIVLHKGKRNTGSLIADFYSDLRSEIKIKYKKHYNFIDHSISPNRLLGTSIGSLSQPISTAALISKAQNIPTAFYNPIGKISDNDPALRGITLLDSPKLLEEWFENLSLFKKKQNV